MTDNPWVVYYWTVPFFGSEQTHCEEFPTRELARDYLRKVRKRKDFLKNEEIRQYKHIELETV